MAPMEARAPANYEPDCDDVNGELIESGRKQTLQWFTCGLQVASIANAFGIPVLPEPRLRGAADGGRQIPAASEETNEAVFTTSPLACIESWSPEIARSSTKSRIAPLSAC